MHDRHIDFYEAIALLNECLYYLNSDDLFKVKNALRNGTLNGRRYSDSKIAVLEKSKQWKRNYAKFIRKAFRCVEEICFWLKQWLNRFKVQASEGEEPGQGRACPNTGVLLFTEETRAAFQQALSNVEYILDLENVDSMYITIDPPEGANHGISTQISLRPESKLEAAHDSLANFANCGTGNEMVDILGLEGIARYNLWRGEAVRQAKLSHQSGNPATSIPAIEAFLFTPMGLDFVKSIDFQKSRVFRSPILMQSPCKATRENTFYTRATSKS